MMGIKRPFYGWLCREHELLGEVTSGNGQQSDSMSIANRLLGPVLHITLASTDYLHTGV